MILDESLFEDVKNDDIPDVEVNDLEVPDIIPDTPKEGPDTGIANLIHDLIIDEHKAVQSYNIAIANLETHPELITIMRDIANDKMTHIGKLEQALLNLSPNAESIMNGAIEAKNEIDEPTEQETQE